MTANILIRFLVFLALFPLAVVHAVLCISKHKALYWIPIIHHLYSLSLAGLFVQSFLQWPLPLPFPLLSGSCQAHTVQPDSTQHQVWAMCLLLLRRTRAFLEEAFSRHPTRSTHHIRICILEMSCGQQLTSREGPRRKYYPLSSLHIVLRYTAQGPLRLPQEPSSQPPRAKGRSMACHCVCSPSFPVFLPSPLLLLPGPHFPICRVTLSLGFPRVVSVNCCCHIIINTFSSYSPNCPKWMVSYMVYVIICTIFELQTILGKGNLYRYNGSRSWLITKDTMERRYWVWARQALQHHDTHLGWSSEQCKDTYQMLMW